jgi:putative ABC transport system ATP-binding protein
MNGIHVTGLSKNYQLGRTVVHALRDVSLELESGSFACIAGPSGSGKTTLLNLIGLVDEPTSGAIRIGGQDVRALDEAARTRYRSRHLGFIFQSFNLLPVLTVFENVRLPLLLHRELSAREKQERVKELVEAVGLAAHARHKPFELSGGQRQRVAIARALVTHPRLVLADEPTANLDTETGAEVLDLMQRIHRQRNTSFLFSTHDPRIMERAGRIIRLRDGRVEAA